MARSRFAPLRTIAPVLIITLFARCGDQSVTAPAREAPDRPLAVSLDPGTVAQISAGDGHTCALKTDRAVVCWGWDYFGQAKPPAGTFTQVSAGGDHSCALTTSGTVACWGASESAGSAPEGTFTQVSAGTLHSCALAPGGAVACWGDNRYGQAVPPAGTFTAVSAGGEHSCALTTTGTLVCWGNTHGESPTATFTRVSAGEYHTCAVSTDRTLACWGTGATPPAGEFIQVAAGRGHSCALRADGTVACWGENRYGQATPPSGTFLQVEAGGSHSCGMRTDRRVTCWGANDAGLAVGWPWFASYAGAGPPTGSFTDVSTSSMQVCAIRSGGAMACWGWNREGQVSPPAGTYAKVSLGGDRSCALTTDGGLVCWGRRLSWDMPTSGRFTQLSVSFDHACVVAVDGAITCWGGQNLYGEATSPAGTFTQVSTGTSHSCAIRSTGELACWGNDSNGQASPPAGTFTQVSAGWKHSCALRPGGSVACWGDNSHGESTPPPGAFTQVRSGSGGTCALDAAGAAVCWGEVPAPPSVRFARLSSGTPICGIELEDQSLACWGSFAFAESPAPPNRAPVALPGGPYAATEGALVPLSLSGTDADGNALTYDWDLGDGTTGSGATPPPSHAYADDGAYTIRLTVDDGHGGVDTKTTTATIANVAPNFAAQGGLTGPAAPIQLAAGNAGAPISIRFTDPAGAHDTYTARIDCGNGTVLTPSGISSPFATSCTYSAAGVYVVSATVADEDGGTSAEARHEYAVVYDPVGAFATGGGWFDSAPSACPSVCGGTASRAHFTFDARFLPGRVTAPEGSARFWLQTTGREAWRHRASLDLRSTSLTMLVVSGPRVQVWGAATVNGTPGYTFRITAVDGGAGHTGDMVRVEIWDPASARVYDNQWGASRTAAVTTPVDGGEIAILKQWKYVGR